MRRLFGFPALAAALTLAGCSTQIGGSGQLSTGEPISAVIQVDMSAVEPVTTVDIASPEGWSCKSVLRDGDGGNVRHTHPMTCSDGATGSIIVTDDNIQKRTYGAFKLDNGRSGQVMFDFKR